MRTARFLISGLLWLVLVGCSSAPKSEDSSTANSPAPWEQPAAASETKKAAPAPTASSGSSRGRDPWAELNSALKMQDEDKIRSLSQEILSQVPQDEKALNSLAMTHYKKGQFDLAAYLLGKAIAKNPNSGALHSNLGLVELARNEKSAAIKSYRKAIELNPNDGVASANLGSIYIQEKDFVKAAVVLETAYRRGPRDLKTLNNYGIALAGTGKYERALTIYQEALKENANSREVLMNQAITLVDGLGRFREGLEVINRLKFIGPPSESRERLSSLENKAKAGVK